MEEYVNHVLDASILNQLVVLFQSGKLCSSLIGKKKKRKLGNLEEPSLPPVPLINQAITKPINYEEKPAVVEISTAKKLASNDFGSIYDDDIVVDKYVPVGSLDETGGAEVAAPRSIAVDTSVYAANLSVRATMKGLFDHKTSAPVVKSASGKENALILLPFCHYYCIPTIIH